jgi:excinuclease ABC subunit C
MNASAAKPNFPSGIQETLAIASSDPGVYIMKADGGEIIYIGKAKNLKKRLAAYFKNSGQMDMKTGVLVKKIAAVDTIITRTENEALILESNLIKKHKPRYNVVLKDDKRYPALRLDQTETYPSFTIVRKIGEDDALYFGPFASAHAVRETLKTINKTFKLRKCKANEFRIRTRPCLHCQMAGCLAPCCQDVDPRVYQEQVTEAILFLKGRTHDLIRKIKNEMQTAAESHEFEKAARLRDKMFSLERTIEKQIVVTTDFKDRDVFAIAGSDEFHLVSLFIVRGGFLTGTRHFDIAETMATDAEIIGAFIRQYYDRPHFVPQEILVPIGLEDTHLLEDWLRNIKKKKVSILQPQKGEKKKIIGMAARNSENELNNRLLSRTREMETMSRLQRRLRLTQLPKRIECFDNSNIGGAEPVASMVVFEDAKANTSAYRKYRIKTVHEPDDYASMAEVLKRRFGKGEASKPYPNLLMVDGGKGQLNIALSVLKDLQLEDHFDVIGIAKKDAKKGESQDKIFKAGRANPMNFGKETDLLLFLQRIRDEAHRFAITYHRKRRTKRALHSILDDIAGIGPKRKTVLLQHFKSIKKIRAATPEELSGLPGFNRTLAESVQQALTEQQD